MKKIIILILFLISLTGCGTKMNDNQELINEMQQVAMQHLKQEYNVEFVVDRYKFPPKHVGPDITFYGHSKENPKTTYTVRVDYEDKVVKLVSHNDHADE